MHTCIESYMPQINCLPDYALGMQGFAVKGPRTRPASASGPTVGSAAGAAPGPALGPLQPQGLPVSQTALQPSVTLPEGSVIDPNSIVVGSNTAPDNEMLQSASLDGEQVVNADAPVDDAAAPEPAAAAAVEQATDDPEGRLRQHRKCHAPLPTEVAVFESR